MKILFYILWAVCAYVGVAALFYIVLTKIDPYKPEDDEWGDGDSNAGLAIFWPAAIPMCCVVGGLVLFLKFLERIRKDIV